MTIDSKLKRAPKAALGSNVRLRTWFFLLAVPILTVLILLLGGAVWGARQEGLQRLTHDGTSMLNAWLVSFTVFVFVLVLGSSIMLSRFLVRPVAFLTRVAREIGSGNFETEIRRVGAGEIGELQASFIDMKAKLQRLHAEQAATERALRDVAEAQLGRDAAEAAS